MSVRVAYGKRKNIDAAITGGTIPKGTMIITRDERESELFFYDTDGSLKEIAEKNRFETMTDAKAWVNKYPSAGNVITVHNGSDWIPYIVQDDNSLVPIEGGSGGEIDITEITKIDGGNSDGV